MKDRQVNLIGEIDEFLTLDVIEKINEINLSDGKKIKKTRRYEKPHKYQAKPIEMIISSPGGEFDYGTAIIAAMEASNAPIHTVVYGQAYSMALHIAVAGEKRKAHRFAFYMYHDGTVGIEGKLETIKEWTSVCNKQIQILDTDLIKRTKLTKKQLKSAIEKKSDWYFGAKEAKRYGVIEEII